MEEEIKFLPPDLWVELYNRVCGFIPEKPAINLEMRSGAQNPSQLSGDFLHLGPNDTDGHFLLVWTPEGLRLILGKYSQITFFPGRPLNPKEWDELHWFFLRK